MNTQRHLRFCFWPVLIAFALCTASCDESPKTHEPEAGALVTDSEAEPLQAAEKATTAAATAAEPGLTAATGSTESAVNRAASCLLLAAGHLRQVEGTRYLVERAALTSAAMELRTQPERWFRDDAIQWSHKAGKAQVTLAGIEPGTDCGVQNGDQILSINGYPSTDKAALKRLEQELLKADQLVIRVQRANEVKTLSYQIVERLPDP